MFSYKGVKPLIFDEFPYKKYMVKCAQPPQLKYLCFDHMEFRIYKGEGNVQLIAYYPFAFSVESPTIFNAKIDIINNIGDLPANLKIIYDLEQLEEKEIILRLRETLDGANLNYLKLSNITTLNGDKYILINSETQLIEGLDAKKCKTGNLYNRFITEGDFFWPPIGKTYLLSSETFERAIYTPMFF